MYHGCPVLQVGATEEEKGSKHYIVCSLKVRIKKFSDARCRYSDWLRAGRPRGRSSSLGRIKNFLFTESRLAPRSTQPPIQRVPGALSPGSKAAEA
jgi:hypothetical protein